MSSLGVSMKGTNSKEYSVKTKIGGGINFCGEEESNIIRRKEY
jgi:hypothetical protein